KRGAPSCDERIRALDRLERALLGRKRAIAAAISRDFGNRSIHETLAGEVFVVRSAIAHAKAHVRDWMEPEEREVGWVYLPSNAEVIPQPLGVVGIISPWNYPLQLSLSPLVSALAAGNRAMIKPSELVPETAAMLRELLGEAFAADEVCVAVGGPEVGEIFSRLPFDHLLFTGSIRVGKLVMRAASENLVPVTMELGGKCPAILGEEGSVRVAATQIMAGKLFSAGQTCVAPDYAMVPASARDAFVDACRSSACKMYPTLRENPDYSTILTDEHLQRLRRLVEDAQSRGARVLQLKPEGEVLDGTRKMAPVLVLDATEDMLVLQEEIFGPILPVLAYQTLAEAIAYVNDHPRPLALYYFGRNRAAIDRVLSETISGGVTVNETLLHLTQDDLPFGGVGPSGMGHYHGREGFETFTKKKPVFRQARFGLRGLMHPPYGRTANAMLRFLIGK
ncbi:MAG TPA: coniferyl aldehyde dehydrogenase, partial [Polyangiaceae bacterium]|nr:coniferyl aldehyde dehydrogenase [Polyangiaceae bacterium]